MDQLLQCPVCTLYLHSGMSLEAHLDTHPKDQVIKALCSLSGSRSNFGSRASTPMHSERSFRSRSRTPASEEPNSRFYSSHANEHERYWRKTPSRAPKTSTVTRSETPSHRIPDSDFDNAVISSANSPCSNNGFNSAFSVRGEKAQVYDNNYLSDQIQNYAYYPDNKEELKYSKSPEYALNSSSFYNCNLPASSSCMKVQSMPTLKKGSEPVNHVPANKKQDFLKIIPKTSSLANNVALLKANMGSVQYITPNVMVSAGQTFVQKNPNNLIVTTNVQNPVPLVQTKSMGHPLCSSQYGQLASTFTPNTTVVTQNSQLIYSEMAHNVDGKRLLSGLPVLGRQDNISNVAQTSSAYQNVMVVDQFGNTSCMYTAPQPILPKQNTNIFTHSISNSDKTHGDSNKTLIIEVGPILPNADAQEPVTTPSTSKMEKHLEKSRPDKSERVEVETPGSNRGLKILSNIKVEVPVQHHKNLLNTVVDLTEPADPDYSRSQSPENILPDLSAESSSVEPPLGSESSTISNTFSVIKNVGNPPSYKDSKSMDVKSHESESMDSCPVPDLICNEKPSISPCSELSEHGDSASRPAPSPERQSCSPMPADTTIEIKKEPVFPPPPRYTPLRLNNIFVKKSKKILQIKNAKFPAAGGSGNDAPKLTDDYSNPKIEKEESEPPGRLETLSVQPEPVETRVDLSQVKEEVSSQELSNHTASERDFAELDSLRPVSAAQYNSMSDFDDDSQHRELLDLGAAKGKHFVHMMSDNYFGDNIYADYFTPERDAFDAARESAPWGEPSQKGGAGGEFVLPNFVDEGYKGGAEGGYGAARECKPAPMDMCADERMPPRGELSPRPAAADVGASWQGMYPEAAPAYDLLARESWLSDSSDMDSNEKHEQILPGRPEPARARVHACAVCRAVCAGPRELRAHRAEAHPPAARALAKPLIKKEERDDAVLAGMLQEAKAGLASSVLDALETMVDSKPFAAAAGLKQEPKRRKRDFVCPTCKVDQLTDVGFHEHLKLHPLECLTCGKCFFRRANLRLHIKTHLGIKNYKCEVCEKRFTTRQKLSEHHNVHTGRAPVKCTVCDRAFRRYSNMVQHRDRHHLHKKAKIRDYVCHCGEIYHSRAKLLWHKETHDGKPKACQYCSDKFVHMSSLTRHVRRTHNVYFVRDDLRKKNDNVPCPICKQVYLRSNLKTHLRTHSGKRPHVCVVCSKAFTTQWNLKLHRWTHMSRSAKPYRCTLCKGAFIRQSEYVSHMNAHKSVRPYTCNYCGCQFIRKYNCQRHVREHEMAKKYTCKVADCGKTFHRSYYLSEHMKVHSGARPFSCNICGKTSSNKSNHNKHVKIHHAREPVATEA